MSLCSSSTDSPFGLDPFSFVSTSIEEYQAFTVAMKQQTTGDIPGLSLYQPSGAAGKIPDLPAPGVHLRARSSETDNVCSAQLGSPMPPPPLPQKERTGPAFNLPATAYPDFLRAIEGSEVPKPVLILELFEAFKHRCTNESGALRKGAVEKKLSEIAYKEKKIWHVRPTEWASHRVFAGVPLPLTNNPTGGGGSRARAMTARKWQNNKGLLVA